MKFSGKVLLKRLGNCVEPTIDLGCGNSNKPIGNLKQPTSKINNKTTLITPIGPKKTCGGTNHSKVYIPVGKLQKE